MTTCHSERPACGIQSFRWVELVNLVLEFTGGELEVPEDQHEVESRFFVALLPCDPAAKDSSQARFRDIVSGPRCTLWRS